MKNPNHKKRGPAILLRGLLIILIGVTLYALQSLYSSASIYDRMNEALEKQSVVAASKKLGDEELDIPTYELFKEDQIWAITSKNRPLKDEKGIVLVDIPVAHGDENLPMKVARPITTGLERLVNAAEADGEPLMVSSAHRSFAEQQETLDAFIAKNGSELASTYVMPVGASEHHTGLAVDFSSVSDDCAEDSNTCSLSQSGAAWLAANSYRFGFIQRYPEGKRDITGVGFEPWHFRFVGKPMAKVIYSSDMTIEEAFEVIAPGYAKRR